MNATSSAVRPVPFDLSDDSRNQAIDALQTWLPDLIALSLRLKQAHWNLRGSRFKSVHEQLDEILLDVRNGLDEVAERIVTIGGAADGLPETVAAAKGFAKVPATLLSVDEAIEAITGDLAVCVKHGRKSVAALGEVDPISEDLAIGLVGQLEKHHWMLHSQRDA